MRKYFLLLFLLPVPALSSAEDITRDDSLIAKIAKKTDSSVDDVKKSLSEGCSSGFTREMSECAYYGWVGADIVLNETYQRLMTALNTKSSKQKLVAAQKAWIAFRDASCEYEAVSWTGGTGYSVVYAGCKADMTVKRTQELIDYLSCKGTGCPGDM